MTIQSLGQYALLLATLLAIYAAGVGIWAHHAGNLKARESARGAAVGIAVALTAAVLSLEILLVAGNFSVLGVYTATNRALPLFYRMAALWGSDQGSIMFWAWILSLYTAYAAVVGWRDARRLSSLAVPFLIALLVFFTGLSLVVTTPFATVPGAPQNGSGLDPLLQNPVMTIHPPAMYTGLIGMAVPFAFFMSALWQRLPAERWIPVVRRWLLFNWMFLSAAIVLGGWWAYMELGWGGYWRWDPVENASLLPWLAATAFLHTLQVQEKRGMFRLWSAALIVAAFLLTLMGTYVTRSGVLKDSVHTFVRTGVGPYFFTLFLVVVGISLVMLWLRRDRLVDRAALQDTLSREGVLFLMAFLLSVIAAVVLFGTFYPVLSQALFGVSVVLKERFFDAVTVPLFLGLVLLMGVVPALGWRSTKLRGGLLKLRWPSLIGLAGGAAAIAWGADTMAEVAAYTLAVFACAATAHEFVLGVRARSRATREPSVTALLRAVAKNRRRYGGLIAHVAFLIIVLGVAGSHTGNYAATRTVRVGQTVAVGPYHVTFDGLTASDEGAYQLTQANTIVRGQGMAPTAVSPGLELFPGSSQPVAHVSILGGWWQDLYAVLVGYAPGGAS